MGSVRSRQSGEVWERGSRKGVAQRHRLVTKAERWAVEKIPTARRRRAARTDVERVQQARAHEGTIPLRALLALIRVLVGLVIRTSYRMDL